MALSSRARLDLLLGVLLTALPDTRPRWRARHFAGAELPDDCRRRGARHETALVRALDLLGERGRPRADRSGRRGSRLLATADGQPVAQVERRAGDAPVSLLHRCPSRLLVVPIGRHAARGRVHLDLLRAARSTPGTWGERSAIANQPIPASLGVVSDLFRVRCGEDR